MTREERRLRLIRRQRMLAEIAQRGAMRGLADAIAQETRSHQLSERSRQLAQGYDAQPGAALAGALAHQSVFASSLMRLAADAQSARSDAQSQAQWHMEQLAAAQTRAQRLADHAHSAERAIAHQRDRAEAGGADTALSKRPEPGLARGLHSNERLAKPATKGS